MDIMTLAGNPTTENGRHGLVAHKAGVSNRVALLGMYAGKTATGKANVIFMLRKKLWPKPRTGRSRGRQCFGGFRWVPVMDPGHHRPQACPFTTPAPEFFALCSFTKST